MISPAAEEILRGAIVCHLGLALDGEPYVVPVSYGYTDGCVYFHGSAIGRKMEMLRANPRVCVAVHLEPALKTADLPCRWSFGYRSVVAYGDAEVLQEESAKRHGLDVLMRQHCRFLGQPELDTYEYADATLDKTAVVCVRLTEATVKTKGE